MIRKWIPSIAVAFGLTMIPAAASAQWYLFLGGGGTFPTSNYGDYAKTGWMVSLGAGFPVGPEGLSVAVEGFYGQNDHETVSGSSVESKTNPYGVMGEAVYTIGDQSKIHPYVLGGLGFLIHKFSTNAVGGASASETQFAWTLGAGVTLPVGSTAGIYGEGRYFGAPDTKFFGAFLGIVLFLGNQEDN